MFIRIVILSKFATRSEKPSHSRKNNFPFYGTVGFLTRFSAEPQKPHSKITKIYLYSILNAASRHVAHQYGDRWMYIFRNRSYAGLLNFIALYLSDFKFRPLIPPPVTHPN